MVDETRPQVAQAAQAAPGGPEEPAIEDVQRLLDDTDLHYVRLASIHSDLLTDGVPDQINAEFTIADIKVQGAEDSLRVHVSHAARFFTAEESVARIEFTHVAHFAYRGTGRPHANVVTAWVTGNVYFMLYPYVRETLQSASMQLGLPPMVLGYLQRGDVAPRNISMVVSTTRLDASIVAPPEHERDDVVEPA